MIEDLITENSRTSLVVRGKYGPRINREALIDAFEDWGYERGVQYYLTLAFNRRLPRGYPEQFLRGFLARLDRKLLGRKWIESTDRTFLMAFLEHQDSNIHFHSLVKFPTSAAAVGDGDLTGLIERIWKQVVPSGSIDLQRIEDLRGLIKYITKEANAQTWDYVLANQYWSKRTPRIELVADPR